MSASRTKRNSKCSKYRRPPWISLLDALEVEEARSSFSQRYTDQPRPAASLAIPQPLTPPPMTAMSKVAPGGAEDSTVPPPSRSAQSIALSKSAFFGRSEAITGVLRRASEKTNYQTNISKRPPSYLRRLIQLARRPLCPSLRIACKAR